MSENGSGSHLIREQTYTLQYVENTENICGRETGERQFCMQAAGACCTQIHHH